jgi:hypothetical protein
MKKVNLLLVAIFSLIAGAGKAQFSDMLIFNDQSSPQGLEPFGNFIQSGNLLYGMTSGGGQHQYGCIFTIDTNGTGYSDIYDFNGTEGETPAGTLTLAGNVLYGTTAAGGAYSDGCIFSVHKDGSNYKDIFDFDAATGENAFGKLTISGTQMFGMTELGGNSGHGVLYSVDTNGHNFKVLVNFDITNGEDPTQDVMVVGSKLYGLVEAGGPGVGILFRIDSNGSGYTPLYDFYNPTGGAPCGDLTMIGDKFYSMTQQGGAHNHGNIFCIDTNGSNFKDLYDFPTAFANGPSGNLTLSGNLLYGMTESSGANGYGNIFSIDTSGSGYTDLFDFNKTDGAFPEGSLLLSGHELYGMTLNGGSSNNWGVAFKDGICNLLILNTVVISNDTCYGGNEGNAMVTAGGGPTPYSYSWSNGTTSVIATSNPTGPILSAGTYTVTVTDNNGCVSTASATITEPGLLTASPGPIDNVSCFGGSNGVVAANASGGVSPYTYVWSGGGTNATKTGLPTGTYTISVTDYHGCIATASTTITQPTLLTVSAIQSGNISCLGGNNGSVSATPSGGTSPYTYSWSGGGSGAIKSGISAGTYTITLTDNNGCTATASTLITQPTLLSVSAGVSANVRCNGGNDGSVMATPSGGTAPYTFAWSGGGTNNTKTGLAIGTYTVTLTDSNGCTATSATTITQPAPLADSATAVNVTCFGDADGSVTAILTGGTSPFTYSWSGGGTNASKTGLTIGNYTVTVTDNCGVSVTSSATVTQPVLLTVSATTGNNETCYGYSDGFVFSTASGGTLPYTYSWSGGGTAATNSSLPVGTYTITLTDNSGCSATASAAIGQPAPITASRDSVSDNGTCNGVAAVKVLSGKSPYTYLWTPGNLTTDTIKGQCAGIYCCTITDSNGCTTTVCITIKSSLGIENISNSNGISIYPNPNNGKFTISASGGSVVSHQLSVEIYNMLGQNVYSQINIPNATFNINISDQPNGIYLIRMLDKDGNLVNQKKVVKTN